MRIAYAGTAKISADLLAHFRERYPIELVISQPDRPAGRGRKPQSPPLARYAVAEGLPLIQPERLHDTDALAAFAEHGIDTILVVAFGQLIREPVLSDFLVLNVHASLLPEYRGAAPVERAIIDGNDTTGLCVMQLEAGLDTGPVARRVEWPIGLDEHAGDQYARIATDGATALADVLDDAALGDLQLEPQDHERATYAEKITAEDRLLDPNQPARAFHDRVRGLAPHIGARAVVDDMPTTIWRTALAHDDLPVTAPGQLRVDGRRLLLACADAWLEILELQPQGRKRMAADAWLAGTRGAATELTRPEQL